MSKLKNILNEYNQTTSQFLNELDSNIKEKHRADQEIEREGQETVNTLQTILHNLRQYSPTTQSITEFETFKNELSKIVKEKQKLVDRILEVKQEKKAAIAGVNKKAAQLNDEIHKLNQENSRMTELLKSETDNLVCRLMKGSGK